MMSLTSSRPASFGVSFFTTIFFFFICYCVYKFVTQYVRNTSCFINCEETVNKYPPIGFSKVIIENEVLGHHSLWIKTFKKLFERFDKLENREQWKNKTIKLTYLSSINISLNILNAIFQNNCVFSIDNIDFVNQMYKYNISVHIHDVTIPKNNENKNNDDLATYISKLYEYHVVYDLFNLLYQTVSIPQNETENKIENEIGNKTEIKI